MTNAEIRAYLRSVDPGAIRTRAEISLSTIAAAIGTGKTTVWQWEMRRRAPRGVTGVRYCRVVAGMARHLEVTDDERR